jgi:hypothetical protein
MTNEEIVERGIHAQEVLTNPTVQIVVDDLIKIITDSFLGSAPHDEDARKRAYYAYQGVRDVVGLLNQMIAAKDQVIQAVKANEEIEEGN